MKQRSLFCLFLCLLAGRGLLSAQVPKVSISPRTVESFDAGWKFFLGDAVHGEAPGYDDSKWRKLNLPHDWSIEGSFSEQNKTGQQEGGLPAGIGWYRKEFSMPTFSNTTVYIEFDGIYRNSEVWINGHYLGKRPNGYISFRYEITPYLLPGMRSNVLAVRVDNSEQPNSRWYTGSGIYRHVRLVRTHAVSVDEWGSFVTTPEVDHKRARVHLQTVIRNTGDRPSAVKVEMKVVNAAGHTVASTINTDVVLKDSLSKIEQDVYLAVPHLWSPDDPYMYKVVTVIVGEDGLVQDQYITPLGIRDFHFDERLGLILNGASLKIRGVCMHHDLGALGAAVNTRAMERQLEVLKSMGCNGIRTSHNPPAPELLDLCDKMGFIVMDEAFDMWRKKKNKYDYSLDFAQWHVKDLEDQVRRDRNHPSVFIWSIGNEIREQFDSTGITIAKELTGIVKQWDSTRPVTSALSEPYPAKNFIYRSGALDLVGLNYHQETYAGFPVNYPGQKFIATETMSALATRGHYDMPSDSIRRWPPGAKKPLIGGNADWTVSAYDNVSAYWGSTHEETWKIIKKYPFLSGLYIWTGFDYLGEPTPYPWPARSSYFGIVDLAGFPKDSYYMYQSEWTAKPVLHIFPHWNWTKGQTVDVWAYYNQADEVELFLNGRSLGVRKKEGDDLHVQWRVQWKPGVLKAISRKNGRPVLVREVRTAGAPARLVLLADRKLIKSDGKDLSFITVRVLDANGVLVPDASNLLNFRVEGEGTLVGLDNGYQADLESFKTSYHKAYNGLCLAIVQAHARPGKIVVRVNAEGLGTASVVVEADK
jgi:beta-galactosidase